MTSTGIPPIYSPSYPFHPTSPSPSSTYSQSHSSSFPNSAASTTATSVFNFPGSPTKPASTTTNSHPYAIKTTSTALLSRSNSNAAQTSNAVHRYVPRASPSPSPISPRSSGIDEFGGEEDEEPTDESRWASSGSTTLGRKGKHRYSRSMTDVPLPMPVPPGVTNNAQNYHTGYSPVASPSGHVRERARSLVGGSNDEEETPKRNYGQMSASNMGPPSTPLSMVHHRHSKSHSGSGSRLNGTTRMELSLPEDPKSWSPSQVAGYLTAVLREGGQDVSHSLARFITERQITGKGFLRLTEGDMNSSETSLTPIARQALLRASNTLRQNTLRERMFPIRTSFSSNSPFDDRHNSDDEESLDLEPGTLDGVTVRPRNRMAMPRTPGRSRNSSISSTSSSASSSGRVREMVNEFERTTSTDNYGLDEEGTASSMSGSRSASPSKVGQHTTHADQSPSKHSSRRALPQRPRVNDLFSGPSLGPNSVLTPNHNGSTSTASTPGGNSAEVEVKEQDKTITRVAKRNINGREPRLLPFPPTHANAGHLTPAHTGTHFPLPSTPDQRNQHPQAGPQPFGPGDYELGFRNALSPQSQAAFVVRHGPSPSNVDVSPNGGAGVWGSRLLPYPPVSSETALHHPRPQRAVGVSDRDAEGVLSPATDAVTSTSNGEDFWTTALESQLSSESLIRSGPGHESGTTSGENGDMSVAELLAAEGAGASSSTQVSGAQAWEMELGDTVKRVQGGETHGAAKKVKIQTPAKTKADGKTKKSATGKDRERLRRPGVIGLFDEAPPIVAQGDEPEKPKHSDEHEKDQQFSERVRNVVAKAIQVRDQEKELVEREKDLRDKMATVDERETEVEEKGKAVVERVQEGETRIREAGDLKRHAEERHSQLDDRDREVERKEAELCQIQSKAQQDVDQRAHELEQRSQEIERKSQEVQRDFDQVELKAKDVQQKSDDVEKKLQEAEERSQAVEERHTALDMREQELVERTQLMSNSYEKRTQEVEQLLQHVQERQRSLDEREQALVERENAADDVDQKSKEVDERSQALDERQASLDTRERELSEDIDRKSKDIEACSLALQEHQALLDERAERLSDDADKQSKEFDKHLQTAEERERALDERAAQISEKSQELKERSRVIEERQVMLSALEQVLGECQTSLDAREQAVLLRERSVDDNVQEKLAGREVALEDRSNDVDLKDKALQQREEALAQRARDISAREEAAWNVEEALAEREQATARAETTLLTAKRHMSLREEKLGARVDESASGVERLGAREEALRRRERAVEERERAAEEKENREAAAAAQLRARTSDEALSAAEISQTTQAIVPARAHRPLTIATDILRQCWSTFVLPVVGTARTPAFLCAPPTALEGPTTQADGAGQKAPVAPPPRAAKATVGQYLVPTWTVRRDAVIGRFTGLTDGYLVLMGLGLCVAVLRALGRRTART